MDKRVSKIVKGLHGEIEIPSDKSISHRAVMFSSLAKGKSLIKNFSQGKDPLSSLKVFQSMGVDARFIDNGTLEIISSGQLTPPAVALDCGNSGTTMRLVSGILAGQKFNSVLTGDESLSKRPMKRVIEPLELMGAKITSVDNHAPLNIWGQKLHGIDYVSKLASAQVKSCILLAGMSAEGKTSVTEPYISRDHTERMLKYMGADIISSGKTVTIAKSQLEPQIIEICGDISSAAYFIAAALIVPQSKIILKNVGLNVEIQVKENWSQVEAAGPDRMINNASFSAYFPDPASQLWRRLKPGTSWDTMGFLDTSSPEYKRFAELGKILETSTDPAARKEAWKGMLEAFMKDPMACPLYALPMIYAKQKNVNWTPGMEGRLDLGAGNLSFK